MSKCCRWRGVNTLIRLALWSALTWTLNREMAHMRNECPHCKGNKTIGWRLRTEMRSSHRDDPFVPISCPVCSSRVLKHAPEHPAMRPGYEIILEEKQ